MAFTPLQRTRRQTGVVMPWCRVGERMDVGKDPEWSREIAKQLPGGSRNVVAQRGRMGPLRVPVNGTLFRIGSRPLMGPFSERNRPLQRAIWS